MEGMTSSVPYAYESHLCICGGTVSQDKVDYNYRRGGIEHELDTVLPTCDSCGENYFDDTVFDYLDSLIYK